MAGFLFICTDRMRATTIISGLPVVIFTVLITATTSTAQNSAPVVHFIDYQRSIPKVEELLNRKEDTLMKQFREKGLDWPARYVYIRSFKYDSQLEVWVKNTKEERYKLFKSYKICAMAGTLGPKRMTGDYQVPEGFYYINEFNPRSEYHLSLGLNYPNASDRMLGDSLQPGGDIFIHGSCVTTGCIPITDAQIEELYVLTAHAKDLGEDFIPVHIFPVNFSHPRSVEYLNKYLETFSEYAPFVKTMKSAFFYFEKYREVSFVLVDSKGEYVAADASTEQAQVTMVPMPSEIGKPKKKAIVRPDRLSPVKEEDLAKVVDKLPVYPGGNDSFQDFLNEQSRRAMKDLDEGQTKAFIMVEYIIDQEGRPVYAKVIRGGNDTMNEKIEDAFLKMPQWSPATRLGKKVAIRLKQTIMVGTD
jgi:murein L,D-transpeptidase YafK